VAGGVLVLCLLPVAVAAWPVPSGAGLDPARLRERILASADAPYQGYVDSVGRLGLPPLPALDEVQDLLGGGVRMRAWYASATAWRVAELATTGERDTYRTREGTFVWDFERNLVAYTAGQPPVRLPRGADLVPPDLARRLLAGGRSGDSLTAVGPRRVAGVAAVGLRLVPADPDTTIGRIDVWADPASGLPVLVEVAGRGGADPVFVSRFLQLRQERPDPGLLTPGVPVGADFAEADSAEVAAALASALTGRLPVTLGGRTQTSAAAQAGISGAAMYGDGLSMFAVLPLPGRLGRRTLAAARDAGAAPVELTGATAYEVRAGVLTTMVVRTDGDRSSRRGWLLAGLVAPELLRRAATELVGSA
jgi:hypothetical protein